jgi:hypothetical protein
MSASVPMLAFTDLTTGVTFRMEGRSLGVSDKMTTEAVYRFNDF